MQAIPVRDGIQSIYRVHRDSVVRNAIVFAVFFATFIFISFQAYDVHTASTTDLAILDLLLDEEFKQANFRKNFFDVNYFMV